MTLAAEAAGKRGHSLVSSFVSPLLGWDRSRTGLLQEEQRVEVICWCQDRGEAGSCSQVKVCRGSSVCLRGKGSCRSSKCLQQLVCPMLCLTCCSQRQVEGMCSAVASSPALGLCSGLASGHLSVNSRSRDIHILFLCNSVYEDLS